MKKIFVLTEDYGREGYSIPYAAFTSEEAAKEWAWLDKEKEMKNWKGKLTKEDFMGSFWTNYSVTEIELIGVD
jgi:hypothetical protein